VDISGRVLVAVEQRHLLLHGHVVERAAAPQDRIQRSRLGSVDVSRSL